MSWTLQAISDELQGQEVEVKHDVLIGRHQDCDVVLQSSAISRRHAALAVRDDQLWLSDLNSSNGTFVNDLKIVQETLLAAGDIVQFANLKFALLAENTDLVIDLANIVTVSNFDLEMFQRFNRIRDYYIEEKPNG